MIIQCMPSPLHESVSSVFSDGIGKTKMDLPPDIRSKLRMKHNQEYRGFGDGWDGSAKVPDLALEVKNDAGKPEVRWVLEVGFDETYDQLRKNMKLWLEGYSEVSMVVIVKITEDPPYRCPISPDEDLQQLGIPSEEEEVLYKDVDCQGEYGPALYKGHQWVGRISEVFLETWVRGDDGKARRYGNRRSLLPPAKPRVRIPLGEFLDLPPNQKKTIPFNIDNFRAVLGRGIKQLAVLRCQRAIKKHAERMGEGPADEEYQP